MPDADSNRDDHRGGTLEKLVERLTYHTNYDNKYLYQFLMTYRSFTTPAELLRLLKERAAIRPAPDADEGQRKVVSVSNIMVIIN